MLALVPRKQSIKGKINMPNNAGTVDATPTKRQVSLSFIDVNGQLRTDTYLIPTATTDAELNALAAAIGAKTNASLYAIGYTNWFQTGVPSKANATDAVDDSVKDNIVLLFGDIAGNSQDWFLPAPIEATLVTGTVNPDPTELADIVTAVDALSGAMQVKSYRYTERRMKNRSVKA